MPWYIKSTTAGKPDRLNLKHPTLPLEHTTLYNNTHLYTMADASDAQFLNKNADISETNIDAGKEDRLAEESEATGKISQGEIII
jgi:hypothetical protein